jgi:hypothetical protein
LFGFFYAFILVRAQCPLFGLVLTIPLVLAMTHAGTAFLCLPFFANRRFLAVGLVLAILV